MERFQCLATKSPLWISQSKVRCPDIGCLPGGTRHSTSSDEAPKRPGFFIKYSWLKSKPTESQHLSVDQGLRIVSYYLWSWYWYGGCSGCKHPVFCNQDPDYQRYAQRNAEHFSSPQTTKRKAEEGELSTEHDGRLSPVKYTQVREFMEAGKASTTYGRSWQSSTAKLYPTWYHVSPYGLKKSGL